MKRTLSIWRTQLTREDWDFPNWPDRYIPLAHDWEFRREKWQRENNGVWPYCHFVELPDAAALHQERFNAPSEQPHKFSHWHRDFPQLPFAKVRIQIGSQKIPESEYSMIERSWGTFRRYYSDRIESIINLTNQSTHPFYDPESGEDEAVFYIPWSHDDTWLINEFKKWLKQNRPPGSPKCFIENQRKRYPDIFLKPKVGRATEINQFKADLKALTAVRLLDRYGKWNVAVNYLPKKFGRNFNRPSAWWDAKKRVEKALSKISVLPPELNF